MVDLPAEPNAYLREAPLIDGDWIDLYALELAEWGARIREEGIRLDEPEDNHPLAWHRITDPTDGSEIDAAVSRKLWTQTKKQLARFPGRIKMIDQRPYLSFKDHVKWKGRRNKGDLTSGIHTGMVVARWNQWVEEHGGEGAASFAGLKMGKLSSYLDGFRYNVCGNVKELDDEMAQRESLIESLQIRKLGRNGEDKFRPQVEHWRELALDFLREIYTMRKAIESINQRYFDGQQALFPPVAEGFNQLLTSLETAIDFFNEDLAGDAGRVEALLNDAGNGCRKSSPSVDPERLIENAEGAAKGQVAYMVDMAKADALDLLGETRQALELAERHV